MILTVLLSSLVLSIDLPRGRQSYEKVSMKVKLLNRAEQSQATYFGRTTVNVLRRRLAGSYLKDSMVFDGLAPKMKDLQPLAPGASDSFEYRWSQLFQATDTLSVSCIQAVYQPYFVENEVFYSTQAVYSNRLHVNASGSGFRYRSECTCEDRKWNLTYEDR